MARRFFKKFLPHPDAVRNNPSVRWLGPAIHNPNLWHLNRRSVAGGVAVGMFFAFILPVAQFLAAALTAIILRVNLPLAMASTLITNPFTFAPWYFLAYKIGALFVVAPEAMPEPPVVEGTGGLWSRIVGAFDTVLAMGEPLLIGLAILAVGFSLGSWLLVNLIWRYSTLARLRRRQRQRG